MTGFRGRGRGAALRLLLVATVTATALAAAPPGPRESDGRAGAGAPTVALSATYADGLVLDVLLPPRNTPPTAPTGRPVVVLLHGCCGDRADLGRLAEALAAAGAVVLNADWQGIRPGSRYPDAYAGVACAVRFARARGAELEGDPGDVTLLGWSDGAMVAAVVAAHGDRLPRTACTYPGPSAVPDAVVGVAGYYGWPLPVTRSVVGDRARAFLGGTPQQAPRAWHDATPYGWLGEDEPRCLTLVTARTDPLRGEARRYAAARLHAGHPVRLVSARPDGDASLISPRTGEGRTTVREALTATARCRSAAGLALLRGGAPSSSTSPASPTSPPHRSSTPIPFPGKGPRP